MKLYPNNTLHQAPSAIMMGVYAVGIITLATLFVGCNRNVEADSTRAIAELPAVYIADIKKEERPLPIRTSGRLATKAEIRLSFKISGIIEGLYVDEGAYVRKGARLARLNLAEIDAQVLQATSSLEKAKRDLGRVEGLYKDSVATLEQYQDAQTGVDIAKANVKIASFNRKHAEIVAPSSGRILRRMAESGELVSPGQPILVFGAQQKGWIVRVGLSDRDIVKLAVGDSAQLSFDAYPERSFTGAVTEIADAADPLSGTFEVEIQVEDKEGLLKSGFIARVDLYPTLSETYDYIPVEALVEGNGREGLVYAYVPSSGEARKVAVRIARILDSEIAISGGLEPYEQVVTEGAAFLKAEGAVQVLSPAE